jgi:hypothetical protein
VTEPPPPDLPALAGEGAEEALWEASHARALAEAATVHGHTARAVKHAYQASALAVGTWLLAWLGIAPPTPKAMHRAWETFLLREPVAAHLGVPLTHLAALARHLELARYAQAAVTPHDPRLPNLVPREPLPMVLQRTDQLLALAEKALLAGPPPRHSP